MYYLTKSVKIKEVFMVQLLLLYYLVLPILAQAIPEEQNCNHSVAHLNKENNLNSGNIISLSTLQQLSREKKLNTPINSLPLSIRIRSALKSHNILTIEDLIEQTEKNLLFIRNLGKQALAEIKNFLQKIGLSLRNENENIIPLSTLQQLSRKQKLKTPINSLPLSVRIRSTLKSHNILTIEDLIQHTEKNLLFIRIAEIKNFLSQIGFSLREEYTIPTFKQLSREQQLNTPIHRLPLSLRTKGLLKNAKYSLNTELFTLKDLIEQTEETLMSIPNFGITSLNEITDLLNQIGLSLFTLQQLSQEQKLNTHIKLLALYPKIKGILIDNGILTIGDLIQQTDRDLLSIKNVGKHTLTEIKNSLNQIGLRLQENEI